MDAEDSTSQDCLVSIPTPGIPVDYLSDQHDNLEKVTYCQDVNIFCIWMTLLFVPTILTPIKPCQHL